MQQSSVKPVPLSALLKRNVPEAEEAESGKAPDNFRPIVMRVGALEDRRKGSAYVEFGATKVVCSVDGPKEPTKSADAEVTEGQVRVFFKDTASATSTNPSTSSGSDFSSANRKAYGIRGALESALRSMICLELFSKAQIDVEVTVLDDDGGVLAAALMAASLALIDSGIQVYDVCVAAHIVVLADGRVIVDPSTASASASSSTSDPKEFPQNAHLSVTVGIMPSLNQVVCCEFVGMAFADQVKHAISIAIENSLKLYPVVRKVLANR